MAKVRTVRILRDHTESNRQILDRLRRGGVEMVPSWLRIAVAEMTASIQGWEISSLICSDIGKLRDAIHALDHETEVNQSVRELFRETDFRFLGEIGDHFTLVERIDLESVKKTSAYIAHVLSGDESYLDLEEEVMENLTESRRYHLDRSESSDLVASSRLKMGKICRRYQYLLRRSELEMTGSGRAWAGLTFAEESLRYRSRRVLEDLKILEKFLYTELASDDECDKRH
ncbi:hypothetical protein B2J88_35900 [Rhodococcus sp. SRB_17]|nr:hypothetical protein [Rhodococcus sp. SRB_17]